jgi:hypothetical protein
MTKAYVLIYDVDHGNREDCNIFYSPVEVFADAETREKRIQLICNANADIGYRTEDLDLLNDYTFDIPEHLLSYDEDEDEDNQPVLRDYAWLSNYEPPANPSGYCFHAYEDLDPFSDDDTMITSVAISPLDYFKKTGYMYDQHCEFELPAEFDEVAEGYLVYEGTVEEARQALLELGLVEDADFTKFIQDYVAEI